jgi:tRNA uridine 5-carboxymethylaminomethyl modification enzyme
MHIAKVTALKAAGDLARSVNLTPSEGQRHGLMLNQDGHRRSAFELLSHPAIGVDEVSRIWPRFRDFPVPILEQLAIDAKYDVYLSRQAADIAAFRRDESLILPLDTDYATIRGLSNEARHKLAAVRPSTIGQAGRIDGMTPAALTLLVAHIRRKFRQTKSAPASK